MAKLHISNGVDVQANWVESIAISSDGVLWGTFPKASLAVHPVKLERNVNALNDTAVKRVIGLRYKGEDSFAIKIKLGEVANQAGWPDTDAGLVQAVSDINGWLS